MGGPTQINWEIYLLKKEDHCRICLSKTRKCLDNSIFCFEITQYANNIYFVKIISLSLSK